MFYPSGRCAAPIGGQPSSGAASGAGSSAGVRRHGPVGAESSESGGRSARRRCASLHRAECSWARTAGGRTAIVAGRAWAEDRIPKRRCIQLLLPGKSRGTRASAMPNSFPFRPWMRPRYLKPFTHCISEADFRKHMRRSFQETEAFWNLFAVPAKPACPCMQSAGG